MHKRPLLQGPCKDQKNFPETRISLSSLPHPHSGQCLCPGPAESAVPLCSPGPPSRRPSHWPVPTPTAACLALIVSAAANAAARLSLCPQTQHSRPQPCCLRPQPPSWGPSSLPAPCCLSPRARPPTTPGRSLSTFQKSPVSFKSPVPRRGHICRASGFLRTRTSTPPSQIATPFWGP